MGKRERGYVGRVMCATQRAVDIIDNSMSNLVRRGVFSFAAATEAVVQLVYPPPLSESHATTNCLRTPSPSRPTLRALTCFATSASCA